MTAWQCCLRPRAGGCDGTAAPACRRCPGSGPAGKAGRRHGRSARRRQPGCPPTGDDCGSTSPDGMQCFKQITCSLFEGRTKELLLTGLRRCLRARTPVGKILLLLLQKKILPSRGNGRSGTPSSTIWGTLRPEPVVNLPASILLAVLRKKRVLSWKKEPRNFGPLISGAARAPEPQWAESFCFFFFRKRRVLLSCLRPRLRMVMGGRRAGAAGRPC